MIDFKAFEAGIRIAPSTLLGASDPLTGKVGEIYWNTTRSVLRICVSASPVWQDLFIHRDLINDATLRWDIANDRWTQNDDLLINQSLVYTANSATPLDLSVRSGTNSTALASGANIVLETGDGGAGGSKGIIRAKTRFIKGEDSAAGLDITIQSGDSSNGGAFGGTLNLNAGTGAAGKGNVTVDAENFNTNSTAASIVAINDIDLTANLIGIKAQHTVDPVLADTGDFYYNTLYKRFRKYNGTSWGYWDASINNTSITLVNYKDDALTTLPATTVTLVDGSTIVDQDWVLFTALTSGFDEIYSAAVSGINITWTQVVFGQSASGSPVDGDIVYVKDGMLNIDYLFAYNGADWAIVGPRRGIAADNSIRWDGTEWVPNNTLNILNNNIYIRDGLASGDLILTSGNDIGLVDGDIILEANTGLVRLNGDRIHIGAQNAGNPASGLEGDIYYDLDRKKIIYHDDIGYRDVDGGNITKGYTGFGTRSTSVISFDDGTLVFSITPTGADYEYYIQGQRFVQNAFQSITIPDVDGNCFIAFFGNALITLPAFTPALFQDYAYIAYVYWDSANQKAVVFGDERHGLTMDGATHGYLHSNLGMRVASGLTVDTFNDAGDGSSNAHAQIGMTGGTIVDEDISHVITHSATPTAQYEQILNTVAQLEVLYKFGASASPWVSDAATVYPFKVVTGVPQYNTFSGSWGLTPVTDTKFFAMWVFATNDTAAPIHSIMGSAEYVDLTTAQANATYASMTFGDFPAQEIKALYRLIFEYNTSFTNTIKVALRSIDDVRSGNDVALGSYTSLGDHGTLSGLTDLDHPATAIFTGTGTWGGILLTASETNVQLALNRIDAKAAKINLINVEQFAADPVVVGAGQVYYDTVNNLYKYYDGSLFKPINGSNITNSDRNLALMNGGTVKWVVSSTTLSWSADAYIQVPGCAEARNRIVAGSVVLAADGDVAYVDINRLAGVAATLTVIVANISVLSTISPANENRVVIARRHNSSVFWGLNDGIRAGTIGTSVLTSFPLADNTSGGLILSKVAADNDVIVIKYSIKRGTSVEVGHLYVTNNGVSAGISGASNELGTIGVTFTANINGSDVEVKYDTTNTGTAAEMRYTVDGWDAS